MSKNTRNRILLTALAALLLVTLTIGGTMAWLVDTTTEVKNTFTTAKVDIILDETQTDRNFEMIPGTVYPKEPYVTVVDGSESCWVFVEVVASEGLENVDWSVDTDNWIELTVTDAPHSGKVYYYKDRLNAGDTKYILDGGEKGQVTIKTDPTNQNMPTSNPTITFYAYACQAANVNEPLTAWNNCKSAPNYPAPATPADGE